MFKPELWQSHDEYRTIVNLYGHRLSRNHPKYAFDSFDTERQKLLNLNLDPVMEYISGFYSSGGRPAIHQAQILRSLILFVLLFNRTKAKTSLTLWVNEILPCSPSLMILSGCISRDDLPPLGSYYDFMNRLWLAARSNSARRSLLPSDKNSNKPKKEVGTDGKLVEQDPSLPDTKKIVADIMKGIPAYENPEAALQRIFSILAIFPSVRLGLINTENLTISGDGTAVVSHASSFGKHLSSCPPDCIYRRDCGRHYSDPDASWGLDSSKKQWYFGHAMYLLACRNNKLGIDLPLLIKFTPAKRHDSKNFLYAIDDFGRNTYGLSPKNICLDSAHDNIPTYRLLEHWDINALIDINSHSKYSEDAPDDISFDKEGHPLCRAGHKMCPWGNDPLKDAHKYRCPLKCGRISSCPYEAGCSPTKYGRTTYIKNHASLRFQPRIPRDSEEYKTIYKERTACERLNDRFLNDYYLQYLKIRGRDHFSFWSMLIGICIHLDARHKAASMYSV